MAKHDDIKEDKKLIKKAFGMHDKQEHPGKHTDLSKLKKGGKIHKMAAGGKTNANMLKYGRGMAKVMNQRSSGRGG